MTTPKSDLDYLLEAIAGDTPASAPGFAAQTMLLRAIHRAIELRDAAKELGTPRGEAGDRAGPLVSPQPNSLGDVPCDHSSFTVSEVRELHKEDEGYEFAYETDYIALRDERDSLLTHHEQTRAMLKEAVGLIEANMYYVPEARAFLDRVGEL